MENTLKLRLGVAPGHPWILITDLVCQNSSGLLVAVFDLHVGAFVWRVEPRCYAPAEAAKVSTNFTHWATSSTNRGDKCSYSMVARPRNYRARNVCKTCVKLALPSPS